MRGDYLAFLSVAFQIALNGQNASTEPFQQWVRQHVRPISPVDDTHGDADLQALNNMISGAHVVAFGEPVHGAHEPWVMRKPIDSLQIDQPSLKLLAAVLLCPVPCGHDGQPSYGHCSAQIG